LLYFSFIHHIIKGHGINLLDSTTKNLWVQANIFYELATMGWKKIVESGRPIMLSEPKPINDWILVPNALPNQYQDPAGPELEPPTVPHLGTYQASSSRASTSLSPSNNTNAQLH
jgi:hypothetical protein